MGIDIDADVSADAAVMDKQISTTGTVDLDLGGVQRDYPIHLVFCIDVSGSMNMDMDVDGAAEFLVSRLFGGDDDETRKIDVAKDGLVRATRQLSSDDTFGVVSFSSSADVEVQPTRGDRARSVEGDITSLDAGGGTDIQAGLRQSRSLLQRMSSERAIEWIVLISDGEGSVPTDSQLEGRYSDDGITIQTAGVGDDYDADTLRNIAQRTQGESRHIKSATELRDFFQAKVGDAKDVVALEPELRLDPAPITTINEVFYTLAEQQSTVDPDWHGDTCVVDLADINRSSPPSISFDVDVLPTEPDLAATVLEATLRTDAERATDEVTIEVGREDTLPAEATAKPAVDTQYIVQKIIDIAMDEGVAAARSEYRKHQDELSADARDEIESTLDEMERDEKSGADDVSRLVASLDDE